jgi:K+-sensing histidine kinase KdpD
LTAVLLVLVVALVVVLLVRETAARRRAQKLLEELESLRVQAQQTDRLVNVGQLVSGLAQDLKSPLQGMLGSVELIAASDPADQAQELAQLRDNVSRAAGIVRNLLAFTETSELNRKWDDLNELVRRAVQQHRSGRAERIAFQGTSRVQLVYVDSRQIEKVVLMLLSHTVHSRRNDAAADVAVVMHRMTSPTDHMVVDIDDPHASSADDEVEWSGDLDACRRVLQAHGGTLEVEPRDAGGVRFHIELPITELVETQAQ